jgi:[ribosomal protein S18]-alanine N-acetyltransferase
MRISRLAVTEVDAIAKLADECGFQIDPAQELQRGFAHFWVARLSDDAPTPDAFLLAWRAADEFDVIALGTLPTARRRGLARSLIAEMLGSAHKLGLRRVLLEARASNWAAINLYQVHGFVVGRTREAYYSNPTEDGVEMSLELDCPNLEAPTLLAAQCSEACR